jgi:hypothetical protein
MKKKIIYACVLSFIIIAAVLTIMIFLKEPGSIMPVVYGGKAYDSARDIINADGGYALCGMTSSRGSGFVDAYLLKLNKNGKKEWDNTFGGREDDRFYSLIRDEKGNYICCGYTSSFGAGKNDFYLVCADKKGNMKFSKTYGTTGNDEAYSLLQVADGGYLLCGNTELPGKKYRRAVYLVKTDEEGNEAWSRTIQMKKNISASCIIKSGDGGYVICGDTDSIGAGDFDALLIKTDAQGNTLWVRTYGGTSLDTGSMVVKADNGGYALAGSCSTPESKGTDIYVVKTDISGNTEWVKNYGGPGIDQGITIINSGDGGFLVGSNSESYSGGSSDIYIMKINSSGDVVWGRNYGTRRDEYIGNIVVTKDKSIAAAGWSGLNENGNYGIYFFKTKGNGLF